ncbi:MAG: hypothetical protein HYR85_23925 [Planctomycetes bacterium]|nr:hypothetical protein [Planctomycetota bacterium]MBI3844023.1 hypothetical protein [Planctomycetota bacterium]
MKSGPLSNGDVIEFVNRNFIPFVHDVSEAAQRGRIAALRPWEASYLSNWTYRLGFAVSVVVTPDGKLPLGATGMARGHWWQLDQSANFVPEKYRRFLGDAKARFDRLRAIDGDPTAATALKEAQRHALLDEIVRAIRDANRNEDVRPESAAR